MTAKRARCFRTALLAILLLMIVTPIQAKEPPYMSGFIRWRSADNQFADWSRNGVQVSSNGALILAADTATRETDPYAPGTYQGGNFYNGGSYLVATAESPAIAADFVFTEAIVSWNAETPPGSWIEVLISAEVGGRWTKWYNMGVWASDTGTVERHSVSGQGDADGSVYTDTLVLTTKKTAATSFRLKVRLFSADGNATPTVRNLSVAYSTAATKKPLLSTGNPAHWDTLLEMPECSQMVYPDGGEVWCSPTSTSMVLGFYGFLPGACAPRVHTAVEGTYDWIYKGYGNWPFNTAYAAIALPHMEGYVARFTSLAQAEEWIAAGVPVIVSFAWGKNDLDGAAIPTSNGHLAVLVGFDIAGNPIVNDPAAASDAAVQRTYDRTQFETQWLKTSGGTVYLIYPEGHATPAIN